MRSLTLTVLTMIVACSREPQLRPSAAPNAVSAETSIAVVDTSTDSSSPAGLTPDSVIAAAPVDTVGALRGLSSRDSLCGHVVENGLGIPNSRRNAVATQLGRPDSTQSQPTPNKHNPAQTDSIVNVFYPGLRLHYIVLGVKKEKLTFSTEPRFQLIGISSIHRWGLVRHARRLSTRWVNLSREPMTRIVTLAGCISWPG